MTCLCRNISALLSELYNYDINPSLPIIEDKKSGIYVFFLGINITMI